MTRTAKNVTSKAYNFDVSTRLPTGSKIKVVPDSGKIKAGQTQTFKITITSNAPTGQYFGQIDFDSTTASRAAPAGRVLQPAGRRHAGASLRPDEHPRAPDDDVHRHGAEQLHWRRRRLRHLPGVDRSCEIVSATGATVNRKGTTAQTDAITLAAPADGIPAIAPGDTPGGGFLDLGQFGIVATPRGDESITNFNVPPFLYGGDTYTRIGIDSNGYIIVGGSTSASDNNCCELQTFPDPTPPNNVLAPFWTDLNDEGAKGISVGSLTDGTNSWIVVQWDTHLFSSAAAERHMQVWIGTGAVQDISYGYDTATTIGADGDVGVGLQIGAESKNGTQGANIVGPPTSSYVVTSTPGTPGGSAVVTLQVKAKGHDDGTLTSTMITDVVAGKTIVKTPIDVTRRKNLHRQLDNDIVGPGLVPGPIGRFAERDDTAGSAAPTIVAMTRFGIVAAVAAVMLMSACGDADRGRRRPGART